MDTRSGGGDLPMLSFIAEHEHKSTKPLLEIMNNPSGLPGVSGISTDCRDMLSAAEMGNPRSALAVIPTNEG